MKIKIFITIIIIITPFSYIFAETIAVVNIKYLIDNNLIFNETLKEMNESQEKYKKNFNTKEDELKKILDEIENSKLILSENEINLKIEDYNNQFATFSTLVDEFNYHYQNEIIYMKEILLKEIVILLEEYAIQNNIDLILDSTSYLIASNSLDITSIIYDKLNNLNFKLDYKNFEKN